jgi:carbamoyltransferase
MPFGPSVLEEYAVNEYFVNGKKSPFMVETFTINDKYLDTFPSIIHVDNTVRQQTVSHEHNPGYYKIIKKVGDITGNYIVLNTSYNMHGEPIVCSPQDALITFKQGPVDYLALGNWLIQYEKD